jgi:alpha-L-fucosidase
VRKLESLKEIYFKSVGNGACWNLNLPPDRTGQINANDISVLDELQDYLTKSFSKDLLRGSKVEASETRDNSEKFAASHVLDDKHLYWTVNNETKSASLTFTLPEEDSFNCFEIKEYIRLGQRIQSFTIEVEKDGKWIQIFSGSTIGSRKLAKFDDVTSSKVKITFSKSLACPVIESVRLYKVL